MSRETRRFVRVYYDDLELDYAEVWFDPTCLATYVRLLKGCDVAWPSRPQLPRAARRLDLATLTRLGLVTLLDNGGYTVKGYEAERRVRDEKSEKARQSVGRRKDRVPTVELTNVATNVPTIVSTTRARPAGAGVGTGTGSTEGVQGEPTDPADAYWSLTGRYPKDNLIRWLDDLGEQYGQEPTTRALVRAHMADASTATLLGRTKDILAAEARALDRRERDEERERLRQKRAAPRELPAWQQEYRRMIGERYGEGAG